MATLTITITAADADGGAGEVLRKMAKQLQKAAAAIPDRTPTGASHTLVIDNAPATGAASIQVTGGPYTSALYFV